MSCVKGWTLFNEEPAIKVKSGKLVVCDGKIRERIHYKITASQYPDTKDYPRVDEGLTVEHSFMKGSGSGGGFEHLTVFVGRRNEEGNTHNFVRYFEDIPSLEEYLEKMTLELDKDWAKSQIMALEKKIATLTRDYHLC